MTGERQITHYQVKNEWCYTSIPPVHLYSIHRENQFSFVLFSVHEEIKSILN